MVGNIKSGRFWWDKCCSDELLRDAFPSLFVLAVSKEEWVEEVWSSSRGGMLHVNE